MAHTEPQTRILAERPREPRAVRTGLRRLPRPEHKRFSRFRAFALHGIEPAPPPFAPGLGDGGTGAFEVRS